MSDQEDKNIKPTLELALAGREFYRRGWVLGTSGNFSMLLARKPLRICVTASGIEKGDLDETNFLELDDDAEILQGFGKPSAETLLHLCIYRHVARARSILHTHSVWGTILSDHFYEQGAIEIEGYEMLKGLSGVTTHEHKESVPIVDNSQDYIALSHVIENVLRENATSSNRNPQRPASRVFLCPARSRRACRIRPGAPRASAVDRGSDSRDVASNWAVLAK